MHTNQREKLDDNAQTSLVSYILLKLLSDSREKRLRHEAEKTKINPMKKEREKRKGKGIMRERNMRERDE